MKKRAVIINDELGTVALGFSKAGYDISAIYVDSSNTNSIRICEENWGDTVIAADIEAFGSSKAAMNSDVDFLAGRILFNSFHVLRERAEAKCENRMVSQAVCLLKEKRPKYFLFQCNRINTNEFSYRQLYENIIELGYTISYQYIDTRLITGLPVNEKTHFIFGSLEPDNISLGSLKSIDALNYSLDFLCDNQTIEDDWYYQINPRLVQDIEKDNYNAVLCWNKNHYKEVEFVSWNARMIPLIAQGNSVRKMTHREIARLKGIPDEYMFSIKNKTWLYQKLIYCPNVQLIQQIVSAISIDA